VKTTTRLLPHTFVFLRHGETKGNLLNLCQGQAEYELTENGRRQAARAARLLTEFNFGRIYASPLSRAYETASVVASLLQREAPVKHSGLMERGWGELEGQPNKGMFEQEELERRPDYREPSGIKGLEERAQFLHRIADTLNSILSQNDTPLIVSHGRFFNSLCDLFDAEPVRQIGNAVPVVCTYGINGWCIEEMEKTGEGWCSPVIG